MHTLVFVWLKENHPPYHIRDECPCRLAEL